MALLSGPSPSSQPEVPAESISQFSFLLLDLDSIIPCAIGDLQILPKHTIRIFMPKEIYN